MECESLSFTFEAFLVKRFPQLACIQPVKYECRFRGVSVRLHDANCTWSCVCLCVLCLRMSCHFTRNPRRNIVWCSETMARQMTSVNIRQLFSVLIKAFVCGWVCAYIGHLTDLCFSESIFLTFLCVRVYVAGLYNRNFSSAFVQYGLGLLCTGVMIDWSNYPNPNQTKS